ncbi:MAG TPA: hypothetical protein VMI31_18925 [Fimbriimonadaceae bacterium]|nr:hypothetical protein [Fimbriimonadaceae bacterium]
MKIRLIALAMAASAVLLTGCSSNENSGPASQSEVNDLTQKLSQKQSSSPDVPLELRNKGVSPGTLVKKGG